MRVPNPCCCGCPLQEAVKIWAIIEIVFASVFLILSIIWLVLAASRFSVDLVFILVVVLPVFDFTVDLALGIILLLGSNNRSIGKCKIWFYAKLVIFILWIIYTVLVFLTLLFFGIIPLIWVIVMAFGLWLVYAFIEELQIGVPVIPGNNVYQQQQLHYVQPPPPYYSHSQVAPMQNQPQQQNPQAYQYQNQQQNIQAVQPAQQQNP